MKQTLLAVTCFAFLITGAAAQESLPPAPASAPVPAAAPAPAPVPPVPSARPLPPQEVELGLQLSHIVYKEPDVMRESGLVKSNGEARRLLKQRAVRVDGATVTEEQISCASGSSFVLEVGKRRAVRVRVS